MGINANSANRRSGPIAIVHTPVIKRNERELGPLPSQLGIRLRKRRYTRAASQKKIAEGAPPLIERTKSEG